MKTTLKIFTLTVAIFAFSNISFGQNTAEATAAAGARIITPITIKNNKALEFGDIVAGANTVTVDPDGVRTGTNEDLFLSVGRTPQAAQFTVSGEKSLAYSVVIVESATLKQVDGTATMTIDEFTHNSSGTLSADDGTEVFSVGANLTVSDSQASGVYAGEFKVTVTYE